ncbi:MAG: hypothetical protein ACI9G1_000242 [Pirellulaceae bacterium]|jgi:hypothetical protein
MFMETPPFLHWALEVSCSLRMGKHWSDPAQTERQLRSVRCYAEAKLENRVFEGVALQPVADDEDPASGFLTEEVHQAYGGQNELERCHGCTANVVEHLGQLSHAGCYDLLTFDDLSPTGRELDEAFRAVDAAAMAELFPDTTPRWYGLWHESPLGTRQLNLLAKVFVELKHALPVQSLKLNAFHSAITTALEHSVPLRIRPEPAGRIEGKQWTVLAHCSRCLATWQREWKKCEVCQLPNRPIAERVRRAKGNRPYWRLERFLGSENVPAFLQRWRKAGELNSNDEMQH